MQDTFGYHLYACGKKGMPADIECCGRGYRLYKVLKHDFFAATGLYVLDGAGHSSLPEKIILKLNRQQHFFGMPLQWLGAIISDHEISILKHLEDLPEIPHLLQRYGRCGFMYEYIEGTSLAMSAELPEDFFDNCLALLRQVHGRRIAYLDMNKLGNILLGSDGRPYLIDFQISLYIDEYFLIFPKLSRLVCDAMQRADVYHLFKHKRRLSPELLRPEELALSRRRSKTIRLHRMVANPFRKVRRALLRYLHRNNFLPRQEHIEYTCETDPARFLK